MLLLSLTLSMKMTSIFIVSFVMPVKMALAMLPTPINAIFFMLKTLSWRFWIIIFQYITVRYKKQGFLSIKKIEPVSSKTKGELFSCRKNWQSARTSIRKDAQKVFEQSGKPYRCAICGYDKHIEIAHIKAVSEFDDSALLTEINHPDNLIALCPNHHWEFDNNLLKLNIVGEWNGYINHASLISCAIASSTLAPATK